MKGILIMSHGELAKGMMNTVSLFFGNLEKMDYLCLYQDDNPDEFKMKIQERLNALDDGDGVLIIGDIIGGTPLNQAAYFANEKVIILGGMNLGMVLEVMANRGNKDIDWNQIIESAKLGINNLNQLLGVSS